METLNKINGKFIINKVQRKDFGLHNGWLFIDLAFIVLHEHDIFEGLAE